ncbi:MAG: ABC transporter permease [Phycisphaerales bacterium]|nr:ABC transporter permease [Phycisphaerales bacterium]
MGAYLARRLLFMVPTLLGITLLVFMLLALAPGGIGAGLQMSGGQMSDTSKVAQMQAYLEDRYGLNDPVIVQYLRWLSRISPVKFGAREQIAARGERIRPPRELDEPLVVRGVTDKVSGAPAGPAGAGSASTQASGAGSASAAPAASAGGADASAEEVRAFRLAQRNYEGARRTYVGSVRAFKDALADYARAIDRPDLLDGKGGAVVERFDGLAFDDRVPQYAKVAEAAATMQREYAAAMAARDALQGAFDGKPFPQSGIGIIDGIVWLDSPDLGVAFSKNRPVADLILTALPVTLLLNLCAFPVIYLVAIPTGLLAATRRGSWFDVFSGVTYLALYSIPTVLAGVFAIGFLANKEYLGAFPVSGLHAPDADTFTFLPMRDAAGNWQMGWLVDMLWHIALPVLCLVYGGFAVLSKQTRAAMLDNFNADYVRTAKAKGVPRKDVIMRHVFRNSLLPLITMFVTIFPATLAGSVIIERIFSVPGMGSLILEAIDLRDREIILANTFMVACVNLIALLIADVLYAIADPRVSYE